jgi:hypothetical protein
MRGPESRRWRLAARLLIVLVAGQGIATASNEGFYLAKRTYPLGARPKGWNLVALPARNPYQAPGGLAALCRDLNLDSKGEIIQIDGQGAVNTHTCGSGPPQWSLIPGVGVIVQDTTLRDGAIVGTDVPNKTLTILNMGPPPKGTNIFPVDYNSIDVTPEDLCQDCGLSSTATVTRFDAATGMVLSHQCGQVSSWNLVKGEAVLIVEDQGTRICRPTDL